MNVASDLRPGDVVAARYRVVRLIGTGGMGAVYEAEQIGFGRKVALKVVREDDDGKALARFEREARTLARLVHPNVVRVIEFDQGTDGPAFMAMELLEGESLLQRMKREGRFAVEDVIAITSSVLRGLDAIHEHHIIHRDLKPSNVFLSRSDGVKILDFGIVKVKGEPVLTIVGDPIMGTPSYLAPEQIRGEAPDARTDLHALGVCMFEMLTGRKPWSARGIEIVRDVLEKVPQRVDELRADVPFALATVVQRALAKDRDERFASAADMLDALERAPSRLPLDTQPDIPLTPDPRAPTMAPPPLVTPSPAASSGAPSRWGLAMICAAVAVAVFAYQRCSSSAPAETAPASHEAPLH